MKKEEFQIIQTNLETRIENCRKHLDTVVTTDDLRNLTVNQLLELRDFCRQESSEMTQICMVDLYHLLGMGKLTVTQQNTFLKLFKEYVNYRSDVKALGSNIGNLDTLPEISTSSKFKLTQLGDVTLYSGRGEICEEISETLSDYKIAKQETDERKEDVLKTTSGNLIDRIKLDGNTLTLPVEGIEMFFAIGGHSGSKSELLKKSKNHGKYVGAWWSFTEDGNLQAVIQSPNLLNNLRKFVK